MADRDAGPNTHVLFVHGVGTHSRLSALMQAYQALRSDTRSPEAPVKLEDPIVGWQLREFADGAGDAGQPRLELRHEGEPGAVYLYEVNYSGLAGVVRRNHPLDLTALFVGFDLALNAARARLARNPPAAPAADEGPAIDHAALALTAQRVAAVFVAATVPILGLPSLVFRRFTKSIVAVYTRFFEDIATFTLDRNGNALIAAHVDHTVQQIVQSAAFVKCSPQGRRDRLVIAAHSLGSVVAHDHQVRHRYAGDRAVLADAMLTYGSPIGLVCWLWLLLDFDAMDIARRRDAPPYFTWDPGWRRSSTPACRRCCGSTSSTTSTRSRPRSRPPMSRSPARRSRSPIRWSTSACISATSAAAAPPARRTRPTSTTAASATSGTSAPSATSAAAFSKSSAA